MWVKQCHGYHPPVIPSHQHKYIGGMAALCFTHMIMYYLVLMNSDFYSNDDYLMIQYHTSFQYIYIYVGNNIPNL